MFAALLPASYHEQRLQHEPACGTVVVALHLQQLRLTPLSAALCTWQLLPTAGHTFHASADGKDFVPLPAMQPLSRHLPSTHAYSPLTCCLYASLSPCRHHQVPQLVPRLRRRLRALAGRPGQPRSWPCAASRCGDGPLQPAHAALQELQRSSQVDPATAGDG